MSGGPIILTLGSWAQQHLLTLLQSTTKASFDTAFNSFIAPNASIVLNGQDVSVNDYNSQLWAQQEQEKSATVNFNGVVAVPIDLDAVIQTGEVGVFYVATISQPPLLFDNIITASLNVIVDQPTEQPANVDKRRVVSLTQVSTARPSNEEPIPTA